MKFPHIRKNTVGNEGLERFLKQSYQSSALRSVRGSISKITNEGATSFNISIFLGAVILQHITETKESVGHVLAKCEKFMGTDKISLQGTSSLNAVFNSAHVSRKASEEKGIKIDSRNKEKVLERALELGNALDTFNEGVSIDAICTIGEYVCLCSGNGHGLIACLFEAARKSPISSSVAA